MNWKNILMASLALITLASCQHTELGLQVNTQQGILEGLEGDSIKMYLGVPFAAAPVGDLRWREPQLAPAWEGVRPAKEFGCDPMQKNVFGDMSFRGAGRSEDCLYLNIWTPARYTDEGLPVLIYFNGGGLIAGSGSEPRYDGAALARKGVIAVTANYREGVFGFMAHADLSAESGYGASGNYGYMDQAAAIRWIQENIQAFGGDPKRIFIAGESAGSFSVSVLMCSPMSRDKIAGAILSSGAYAKTIRALSLDEAEQKGAERLEKAGLGSIAEARALSADELLDRMEGLNMRGLVIDHHFLYEELSQTMAKHEQAQVPMLAGWNSQEGTPTQYLHGMEPTLANLKEGLRPALGELTDEILEAYGVVTDQDIFGQRATDLCGDLFTGFCTWSFCDEHSRAGLPVYRYKFNHPRPAVSARMAGMSAALAGGVREQTEEDKKREELAARFVKGAVHSADIEYAMGNLATNEYYEWNEDDYAISELFLSYYAQFCKNGNPNGEGLPVWDSQTGKDVAPVMQIDVHSEQVADERIEKAYHVLEKLYN